MSNIYNCTSHIIKIPDMQRAEGIYVYDSGGKKYMDLESGVWCTSVGHNNERLNDVIKKQIGLIMHAGFSYSNTIVEESAESILKITGLENGKCVFLCSGSEAIELARQISKKVTGKKISMTMHDSYLGSYSSVTDRSENWYIFNWERCKDCKFKENCLPDCEQIKKIPEDISEFILEPGSSSGFVRFPPESLIRNIVEIVRKNRGKIISNEVTTGIGRTGRWFGFEHYGIEPDMIAIGKGVGNGYPVSVTVLNEKATEEAADSGFKYMQSHQNDPLGASIVKEVINIIDSGDLIAEAERKGELFLQQLTDLKEDAIITGVRGRGL
ncbi:MAG: aminotransferase class III-fold pyridoxal phosphate-dependent enzyme, partial [Candidatus Aminicenantes bacterium]|nr:aminotransferase class III-fold pyridoxal phosphate-dependent enzyme [Candidatus Aminicenantes bacterium]